MSSKRSDSRTTPAMESGKRSVGGSRPTSSSSFRTPAASRVKSSPTTPLPSSSQPVTVSSNCNFRYMGRYLLIILSDGCDQLRQQWWLKHWLTMDDDDPTIIHHQNSSTELNQQWFNLFSDNLVQQVNKGLSSWNNDTDDGTEIDEKNLEDFRFFLEKLIKNKINDNDKDQEMNIKKESDYDSNELMLQYAQQSLALEILLNPTLLTLTQCLKNILKSPTSSIRIIYAGATFSETGSWIISDGVFSAYNFYELITQEDKQLGKESIKQSMVSGDDNPCQGHASIVEHLSLHDIRVQLYTHPSGEWQALKELFSVQPQSLQQQRFTVFKSMQTKKIQNTFSFRFTLNQEFETISSTPETIITQALLKHIRNRLSDHYQWLFVADDNAIDNNNDKEYPELADVIYRKDPKDAVGFIRLKHPTMYVVPSGQGDCSLLSLDGGFTMLLDGGFMPAQHTFWSFIKHLQRLDSVVVTHLGEDNFFGLLSFLTLKLMRKKYGSLAEFPRIGYLFCNDYLVDWPSPTSSTDDSLMMMDDDDPTTLSMKMLAEQFFRLLKKLQIDPLPCLANIDSLNNNTDPINKTNNKTPLPFSMMGSTARIPQQRQQQQGTIGPITPITLYHKVGIGTLYMYVLNPTVDSIRANVKNVSTNSSSRTSGRSTPVSMVHGSKTDTIGSTLQSDSVASAINKIPIPETDQQSICTLLIWRPHNPKDRVVRILLPGNCHQSQILEGLQTLMIVSKFDQSPPLSATQASSSNTSSPNGSGLHLSRRLMPTRRQAVAADRQLLASLPKDWPATNLIESLELDVLLHQNTFCNGQKIDQQLRERYGKLLPGLFGTSASLHRFARSVSMAPSLLRSQNSKQRQPLSIARRGESTTIGNTERSMTPISRYNRFRSVSPSPLPQQSTSMTNVGRTKRLVAAMKITEAQKSLTGTTTENTTKANTINARTDKTMANSSTVQIKPISGGRSSDKTRLPPLPPPKQKVFVSNTDSVAVDEVKMTKRQHQPSKSKSTTLKTTDSDDILARKKTVMEQVRAINNQKRTTMKTSTVDSVKQKKSIEKQVKVLDNKQTKTEQKIPTKSVAEIMPQNDTTIKQDISQSYSREEFSEETSIRSPTDDEVRGITRRIEQQQRKLQQQQDAEAVIRAAAAALTMVEDTSTAATTESLEQDQQLLIDDTSSLQPEISIHSSTVCSGKIDIDYETDHEQLDSLNSTDVNDDQIIMESDQLDEVISSEALQDKLIPMTNNDKIISPDDRTESAMSFDENNIVDEQQKPQFDKPIEKESEKTVFVKDINYEDSKTEEKLEDKTDEVKQTLIDKSQEKIDEMEAEKFSLENVKKQMDLTSPKSDINDEKKSQQTEEVMKSKSEKSEENILLKSETLPESVANNDEINLEKPDNIKTENDTTPIENIIPTMAQDLEKTQQSDKIIPEKVAVTPVSTSNEKFDDEQVQPKLEPEDDKSKSELKNETMIEKVNQINEDQIELEPEIIETKLDEMELSNKKIDYDYDEKKTEIELEVKNKQLEKEKLEQSESETKPETIKPELISSIDNLETKQLEQPEIENLSLNPENVEIKNPELVNILPVSKEETVEDDVNLETKGKETIPSILSDDNENQFKTEKAFEENNLNNISMKNQNRSIKQSDEIQSEPEGKEKVCEIPKVDSEDNEIEPKKTDEMVSPEIVQAFEEEKIQDKTDSNKSGAKTVSDPTKTKTDTIIQDENLKKDDEQSNEIIEQDGKIEKVIVNEETKSDTENKEATTVVSKVDGKYLPESKTEKIDSETALPIENDQAKSEKSNEIEIPQIDKVVEQEKLQDKADLIESYSSPTRDPTETATVIQDKDEKDDEQVKPIIPQDDKTEEEMETSEASQVNIPSDSNEEKVEDVVTKAEETIPAILSDDNENKLTTEKTLEIFQVEDDQAKSEKTIEMVVEAQVAEQEKVETDTKTETAPVIQEEHFEKDDELVKSIIKSDEIVGQDSKSQEVNIEDQLKPEENDKIFSSEIAQLNKEENFSDDLKTEKKLEISPVEDAQTKPEKTEKTDLEETVSSEMDQVVEDESDQKESDSKIETDQGEATPIIQNKHIKKDDESVKSIIESDKIVETSEKTEKDNIQNETKLVPENEFEKAEIDENKKMEEITIPESQTENIETDTVPSIENRKVEDDQTNEIVSSEISQVNKEENIQDKADPIKTDSTETIPMIQDIEKGEELIKPIIKSDEILEKADEKEKDKIQNERKLEPDSEEATSQVSLDDNKIESKLETEKIQTESVPIIENQKVEADQTKHEETKHEAEQETVDETTPKTCSMNDNEETAPIEETQDNRKIVEKEIKQEPEKVSSAEDKIKPDINSENKIGVQEDKFSEEKSEFKITDNEQNKIEAEIMEPISSKPEKIVHSNDSSIVPDKKTKPIDPEVKPEPEIKLESLEQTDVLSEDKLITGDKAEIMADAKKLSVNQNDQIESDVENNENKALISPVEGTDNITMKVEPKLEETPSMIDPVIKQNEENQQKTKSEPESKETILGIAQIDENEKTKDVKKNEEINFESIPFIEKQEVLDNETDSKETKEIVREIEEENTQDNVNQIEKETPVEIPIEIETKEKTVEFEKEKMKEEFEENNLNNKNIKPSDEIQSEQEKVCEIPKVDSEDDETKSEKTDEMVSPEIIQAFEEEKIQDKTDSNESDSKTISDSTETDENSKKDDEQVKPIIPQDGKTEEEMETSEASQVNIPSDSNEKKVEDVVTKAEETIPAILSDDNENKFKTEKALEMPQVEDDQAKSEETNETVLPVIAKVDEQEKLQNKAGSIEPDTKISSIPAETTPVIQDEHFEKDAEQVKQQDDKTEEANIENITKSATETSEVSQVNILSVSEEKEVDDVVTKAEETIPAILSDDNENKLKTEKSLEISQIKDDQLKFEETDDTVLPVIAKDEGQAKLQDKADPNQLHSSTTKDSAETTTMIQDKHGKKDDEQDKSIIKSDEIMEQSGETDKAKPESKTSEVCQVDGNKIFEDEVSPKTEKDFIENQKDIEKTKSENKEGTTDLSQIEEKISKESVTEIIDSEIVETVENQKSEDDQTILKENDNQKGSSLKTDETVSTEIAQVVKQEKILDKADPIESDSRTASYSTETPENDKINESESLTGSKDDQVTFSMKTFSVDQGKEENQIDSIPVVLSTDEKDKSNIGSESRTDNIILPNSKEEEYELKAERKSDELISNEDEKIVNISEKQEQHVLTPIVNIDSKEKFDTIEMKPEENSANIIVREIEDEIFQMEKEEKIDTEEETNEITPAIAKVGNNENQPIENELEKFEETVPASIFLDVSKDISKSIVEIEEKEEQGIETELLLINTVSLGLIKAEPIDVQKSVSEEIESDENVADKITKTLKIEDDKPSKYDDSDETIEAKNTLMIEQINENVSETKQDEVEQKQKIEETIPMINSTVESIEKSVEKEKLEKLETKDTIEEDDDQTKQKYETEKILCTEAEKLSEVKDIVNPYAHDIHDVLLISKKEEVKDFVIGKTETVEPKPSSLSDNIENEFESEKALEISQVEDDQAKSEKTNEMVVEQEKVETDTKTETAPVIQEEHFKKDDELVKSIIKSDEIIGQDDSKSQEVNIEDQLKPEENNIIFSSEIAQLNKEENFSDDLKTEKKSRIPPVEDEQTKPEKTEKTDLEETVSSEMGQVVEDESDQKESDSKIETDQGEATPLIQDEHIKKDDEPVKSIIESGKIVETSEKTEKDNIQNETKLAPENGKAVSEVDENKKIKVITLPKSQTENTETDIVQMIVNQKVKDDLQIDQSVEQETFMDKTDQIQFDSKPASDSTKATSATQDESIKKDDEQVKPIVKSDEIMEQGEETVGDKIKDEIKSEPENKKATVEASQFDENNVTEFKTVKIESEIATIMEKQEIKDDPTKENNNQNEPYSKTESDPTEAIPMIHKHEHDKSSDKPVKSNENIYQKIDDEKINENNENKKNESYEIIKQDEKNEKVFIQNQTKSEPESGENLQLDEIKEPEVETIIVMIEDDNVDIPVKDLSTVETSAKTIETFIEDESILDNEEIIADIEIDESMFTVKTVFKNIGKIINDEETQESTQEHFPFSKQTMDNDDNDDDKNKNICSDKVIDEKDEKIEAEFNIVEKSITDCKDQLENKKTSMEEDDFNKNMQQIKSESEIKTMKDEKVVEYQLKSDHKIEESIPSVNIPTDSKDDKRIIASNESKLKDCQLKSSDFAIDDKPLSQDLFGFGSNDTKKVIKNLQQQCNNVLGKTNQLLENMDQKITQVTNQQLTTRSTVNSPDIKLDDSEMQINSGDWSDNNDFNQSEMISGNQNSIKQQSFIDESNNFGINNTITQTVSGSDTIELHYEIVSSSFQQKSNKTNIVAHQLSSNDKVQSSQLEIPATASISELSEKTIDQLDDNNNCIKLEKQQLATTFNRRNDKTIVADIAVESITGIERPTLDTTNATKTATTTTSIEYIPISMNPIEAIQTLNQSDSEQDKEISNLTENWTTLIQNSSKSVDNDNLNYKSQPSALSSSQDTWTKELNHQSHPVFQHNFESSHIFEIVNPESNRIMLSDEINLMNPFENSKSQTTSNSQEQTTITTHSFSTAPSSNFTTFSSRQQNIPNQLIMSSEIFEHSVSLDEQGTNLDQQQSNNSSSTITTTTNSDDNVLPSVIYTMSKTSPNGRRKFDADRDWDPPMALPSPQPPPPTTTFGFGSSTKIRSNTKLLEGKSSQSINPIYVELAYVPGHGKNDYCDEEFFCKIRARYYVFSGLQPNRKVFDALLSGVSKWNENDWHNENDNGSTSNNRMIQTKVTIVPTYESETLTQWSIDNQEKLQELGIEIVSAASRCWISLLDRQQPTISPDDNTNHSNQIDICHSYKIEF